MTASADLLDQLTIDDYARLAFSLDPRTPSGFGEGGVFAGPLENAPDAQPWHEQYRNPADRSSAGTPVTARARLVRVPAGKVFVRWADSGTLSDWKASAGGAWWVTDNMADRVVQEAVRRFGPRVNSNIVAREYAQVDRGWTTDMGAVVVCRTTRPIKVLIGVGRPVAGAPVAPQEIRDALQVIILTTIASPKNTPGRSPTNRSPFIGDQFMVKEWHGASAAFTDWWVKQGLVERRRIAQRIALRPR